MQCNYFDRESLCVIIQDYIEIPPGRGELDLALDVSANCTLNALVIP